MTNYQTLNLTQHNLSLEVGYTNHMLLIRRVLLSKNLYMKIKTVVSHNMTFDQYWSKNKTKLMGSKIPTELVAQTVWNDYSEMLTLTNNP